MTKCNNGFEHLFEKHSHRLLPEFEATITRIIYFQVVTVTSKAVLLVVFWTLVWDELEAALPQILSQMALLNWSQFGTCVWSHYALEGYLFEPHVEHDRWPSFVLPKKGTSRTEFLATRAILKNMKLCRSITVQPPRTHGRCLTVIVINLKQALIILTSRFRPIL